MRISCDAHTLYAAHLRATRTALRALPFHHRPFISTVQFRIVRFQDQDGFVTGSQLVRLLFWLSTTRHCLHFATFHILYGYNTPPGLLPTCGFPPVRTGLLQPPLHDLVPPLPTPTTVCIHYHHHSVVPFYLLA